MNKEIIIKLWRFAYIKIFDRVGHLIRENDGYFRDKNGDYYYRRLLGKIYWITKEN